MLDDTQYGKLKIVDAVWTRVGNVLTIECTCGTTFEHRADRWTVKCPCCVTTANLADLRIAFVEMKKKGLSNGFGK